MNKLFITGLFILFMCGPGDMVSKVQAQQPNPICQIMDKDTFLAVSEPTTKRTHWIAVNVRVKYVNQINEVRVKRKLWEFTDVKKMLVKEMVNDSLLILLFDSNDCIIPGSALAGTVAEWKDMVTNKLDVPELMEVIGRDI